MPVDTIQKVTRVWRNQNRPQVLEFRFDLATQFALVQANKGNFRFRGDNANNGLSINAMLNSWRSVIRELNIRTFCTPDSDIRKLLHDSYRVLELLGGSLARFLLLQKLQLRAFKAMNKAAEELAEREALVFGVTKQIPVDEGSDGDDESTHGIYCG